MGLDETFLLTKVTNPFYKWEQIYFLPSFLEKIIRPLF